MSNSLGRGHTWRASQLRSSRRSSYYVAVPRTQMPCNHGTSEHSSSAPVARCPQQSSLPRGKLTTCACVFVAEVASCKRSGTSFCGHLLLPQSRLRRTAPQRMIRTRRLERCVLRSLDGVLLWRSSWRWLERRYDGPMLAPRMWATRHSTGSPSAVSAIRSSFSTFVPAVILRCDAISLVAGTMLMRSVARPSEMP